MAIAVHHRYETETCLMCVRILERKADLFDSSHLRESFYEHLIKKGIEFSGGGLARLSGRNSDVAHVDVVHDRLIVSSCVRGDLIDLFYFELI